MGFLFAMLYIPVVFYFLPSSASHPVHGHFPSTLPTDQNSEYWYQIGVVGEDILFKEEITGQKLIYRNILQKYWYCFKTKKRSKTTSTLKSFISVGIVFIPGSAKFLLFWVAKWLYALFLYIFLPVWLYETFLMRLDPTPTSNTLFELIILFAVKRTKIDSLLAFILNR